MNILAEATKRWYLDGASATEIGIRVRADNNTTTELGWWEWWYIGYDNYGEPSYEGATDLADPNLPLRGAP